LGLEPHLIAAKLMRRIYLMEPFHTIHGAVRGEQVVLCHARIAYSNQFKKILIKQMGERAN
jgi:hypothetical protein